jgi:hypothetical protein
MAAAAAAAAAAAFITTACALLGLKGMSGSSLHSLDAASKADADLYLTAAGTAAAAASLLGEGDLLPLMLCCNTC